MIKGTWEMLKLGTEVYRVEYRDGEIHLLNF